MSLSNRSCSASCRLNDWTGGTAAAGPSVCACTPSPQPTTIHASTTWRWTDRSRQKPAGKFNGHGKMNRQKRQLKRKNDKFAKKSKN
jgi:hypothetical protein